jgi:FlaA1/EpsC-like NDP-sugar epimerase
MPGAASAPPTPLTGSFLMSPAYRRIVLQRAARLFDLGIVIVALLLSFAVSAQTFSWPSFAHLLVLRIQVLNILIFAGYLVLCSVVFSSCGFYLSHRLSRWTRRLREIFAATTLITATMLALRWPLKLGFVTDVFLAVFWTVTFAVCVITRMVGQQLLYYFRTRGKNLRSIVIVGEGAEAAELADRLQRETTLGYRVVGIIDATGDRK